MKEQGQNWDKYIYQEFNVPTATSIEAMNFMTAMILRIQIEEAIKRAEWQDFVNNMNA